MTTHADAITERLPTLYGDGDLVRGLAGVLGLQLEIIDAEARRIQRAHWFDTTVELSEAGALGALLDIAAEPWQTLDEYRAWFHALRTARLEFGAVTVPALQTFTRMYVDAFVAANGIDAIAPFDVWARAYVRNGNALVENPTVRRTTRLCAPGAVEPLAQQTVHNGGLGEAALSILFTGSAVTEYVPVLVNRDTRVALAFMGELNAGDRLWVIAGPDGSVVAQLNRTDVSAQLRTISSVSAGQPWGASDIASAPKALTLRPGDNNLWFLPVAHFDQRGLDRALLALADSELHDGRFDSSAFNEALFYLDPAVYVDLAWDEPTPAALRIDLDAGAMQSPAGKLDDALDAVEQLRGSVVAGIRKLVAAGVAGDVSFRPHHESQRQLDHLTFVSGRREREVGSVGIDTLTDAGGLFGITAFDDSTFQ